MNCNRRGNRKVRDCATIMSSHQPLPSPDTHRSALDESGDDADTIAKNKQTHQTPISRDGLQQRDLFDPPEDSPVQPKPPPKGEVIDFAELSDEEVIDGIPGASLSNATTLCADALKRRLGDRAVPAFTKLWDNYQGFGRTKPWPEQICALEALAKTGTRTAAAAIRKIITSRDIPPGLLHSVLDAAVSYDLSFSMQQVVAWLEHEKPLVRSLGYTLAKRSNPPARILQDGIEDSDPTVRRAALITAGMLGHQFAKEGLLYEMNLNPNSKIVSALAAIADENIVTQLGRCGERNANLRPVIVKELLDMDNPRAGKLARFLASKT